MEDLWGYLIKGDTRCAETLNRNKYPCQNPQERTLTSKVLRRTNSLIFYYRVFIFKTYPLAAT